MIEAIKKRTGLTKQESADVLKRSKNTLIPWSTYYGLLNASWNLELKAKVLKNTQKDRVEVKVNTVDDNGKEIQKCFVWYTPYLKDDDQHETKFDKLSTPTTDLVPPGKWNIWTEKGGNQNPKSVVGVLNLSNLVSC